MVCPIQPGTNENVVAILKSILKRFFLKTNKITPILGKKGSLASLKLDFNGGCCELSMTLINVGALKKILVLDTGVKGTDLNL